MALSQMIEQMTSPLGCSAPRISSTSRSVGRSISCSRNYDGARGGKGINVMAIGRNALLTYLFRNRFPLLVVHAHVLHRHWKVRVQMGLDIVFSVVVNQQPRRKPHVRFAVVVQIGQGVIVVLVIVRFGNGDVEMSHEDGGMCGHSAEMKGDRARGWLPWNAATAEVEAEDRLSMALLSFVEVASMCSSSPNSSPSS